jgi:hypothetical protein
LTRRRTLGVAMLWAFHFVMFVMFIGSGVPALSALDDRHWTAAAVWGGLAATVLCVEIFAAKVFLPWILGREPYDD